MKYKLCFLTCLLAVGVLASCGTYDQNDYRSSNSELEDKKQLDAPANLRYDNGFLKWNVVEFATNYFVKIDGEEYSSNLNSFDLLTINLKSGNHEAMVKSIGSNEYYSSLYSNIVNFTYENPNEKPLELPDSVKTEDLFNNSDAYRVKEAKDSNGDSILTEAFTVYNHDYYIYQIGLIESVPLQENVETKKYNGQTKDTLEFTTTVSTTESIESTLESVVSKTAKVDSSIEASMSSSFILEFEIKSSISVSSSFTTSHSDSVTRAVSKTETYSKKVSYTFEPDISAVGHYRHILVGNIVVYFLEVYDHSTKEKLVGTKYSVISSTEVCLEYSKDDPTFSRSRFDTIEFTRSNSNLPKIEHDYTEAYDQIIDLQFDDKILSVIPNLGIMKINLNSFYTRDEDNVVKNIDYEFYSDNVLSIYPLYKGIPINQIIFEGLYNKVDEYGILLDNLVGDLSVKFEGNWDIEPDIVFKNLGLFSSHGESIFDFTKFENISIMFKGENYLESRSNSHEAIIKGKSINFYGGEASSLKILANTTSKMNGTKGIIANNLTIKGKNSLVTIKGGDAGDATTSSTDGYIGGNGIECLNFYAEGLLNFAIYGGNGGKGSQGSARAGNGGQGGNSLVADEQCYIEANEFVVVPGKGGDGANGLDGINGKNGSNAESDSTNNGGNGSNGADGQNGGNGGSTGIGILSNELLINCENNKAIIYQNGAGGKGGAGGRGGNGGSAGSKQTWTGSPNGNGKGGNAGAGGKGGDGGSTGFTGLPYKASNIDIKIPMQIELISLNKLSGQAGNGGKGGNGGDTGQTNRWGGNKDDAGYAGKGGNSGKTGDVLINEIYRSMIDGSLFIADNNAAIGYAGSPGMYALGKGPNNVGYSNKTNTNGISGGKGSLTYVS